MCRCVDCKKASADYQKSRYTPVSGVPKARKTGEDIEHGAYKYTRYGCRCEICTEAQRLKVRDYRERAKKGLTVKKGTWARKIKPLPRSRFTQEQLDRALYHLQDGCSYTEAGRTVGMSAQAVKSYFPGYEGQGRLNMVEINSRPELKKLHDEIWNMKL